MHDFSAVPMDQHVWLNGTELKGNDKQLGALGIVPGSVLMLKVQWRVPQIDSAAKLST